MATSLTVMESRALCILVLAAVNCLLLLFSGVSKSFRKPSRTMLGEAAPQFSQSLGMLSMNSRTRAVNTSREWVYTTSCFGFRFSLAMIASYL